MKILTATYSESVRVNLGDYEHRDAFVSCVVELEKDETVECVGKKVRRFLRNELKVVEKRIRKSCEEDVEYETLDRLNYYNKKK